jgi:toxin FitB
MSYLIDTNVLSELRRKVPDARVVQWFAARPVGTLYLSVLTLGEIRKGIEAMPKSARRLALLDWLETELPAFFEGRVLPVDAAVADRPLPAIDSLLVATAAHHGMTFVTRNVMDMKGLSVQLVNPWEA